MSFEPNAGHHEAFDDWCKACDKLALTFHTTWGRAQWESLDNEGHAWFFAYQQEPFFDKYLDSLPKEKKRMKMSELEKLIKQISDLPGAKIVTLTSFTYELPTMDIDVSPDGVWGDELEYVMFFGIELGSAMFHTGGGLTIRQLLDGNYIDRKSGKTLPRHRLYAVQLGEGKVTRLPRADAELMHTTDIWTRQRIDPQEGIEFSQLED